jgi:hypothetical protein
LSPALLLAAEGSALVVLVVVETSRSAGKLNSAV